MADSRSQYREEIIYYNYTIFLSPGHAERDGKGNFYVYFEGEKKKISTDAYRFSTPQYPITYERVKEKLKGTRGVAGIEGHFVIPTKESQSIETKEE